MLSTLVIPVGNSEFISEMALSIVSMISDISWWAFLIHEQSELVSLLYLPEARDTMLDKDGSMLVRKLKMFDMEALLSSLNGKDGSSNRF